MWAEGKSGERTLALGYKLYIQYRYCFVAVVVSSCDVDEDARREGVSAQ